jgi:arginase family enzyme
MTSVCFNKAKIFGAAIDVSDDPWTLELKKASMYAQQNGANDIYKDPYDALITKIHKIDSAIEPIGKLPVLSWLGPIPDLSDEHLITKENMEKYVADGGLLSMSIQVKEFVKKHILPEQPVMLGVDHSATGGVVSALSEEFGAENLCVIVLDQHFDGLPLSLRLQQSTIEQLGQISSLSNIADDNEYCCGNFWKHLIDTRVVLPDNLLFIGVADYPAKEAIHVNSLFRENYLAFETKGCRFFPLEEFEGNYINNLRKFISNNINTSHVYLSLDIDVGAYNCVHAARYMDTAGINKKALLDIARIISKNCRSGKFRLAGLDIMEFNMHFLDLESEPGKKDNTISTIVDFMKVILSS